MDKPVSPSKSKVPCYKCKHLEYRPAADVSAGVLEIGTGTKTFFGGNIGWTGEMFYCNVHKIQLYTTSTVDLEGKIETFPDVVSCQWMKSKNEE